VEELSIRYHFNLLAWESTNLPAKWLRLLGRAVFQIQETSDQRLKGALEYFRLKGEEGSLQEELDRAAAMAGSDISDLEQLLEAMRHRINDLRPQAEETLEAAITDVLRKEGIPFGIWGLALPPVDFALDKLPKLLIISPRERIERIEDVLLTPELTIQERDALEVQVARQEGLSALVTEIGGISTYPSIISAGDMRGAISIASHEWLHHYLFFHPLGQNYHRDADMSSLNETTANIFSEELMDLVFTSLTGGESPQVSIGFPTETCPDEQFCLDRELRETRLLVDELLAQGWVEEAEEYMELRRQVFVKNGYYIRKLNQAYFAFHGTYADSPSSVSPIYEQLQTVRRASQSIGEFIQVMAGISSYDEFTDLLQDLSGDSE
jgi:hypothetical protein